MSNGRPLQMDSVPCGSAEVAREAGLGTSLTVWNNSDTVFLLKQKGRGGKWSP